MCARLKGGPSRVRRILVPTPWRVGPMEGAARWPPLHPIARKPEGMRPQTSRSRANHVPPARHAQDPRLDQAEKRRDGTRGSAAPSAWRRRSQEPTLGASNLPLLTVRLVRTQFKKRDVERSARHLHRSPRGNEGAASTGRPPLPPRRCCSGRRASTTSSALTVRLVRGECKKRGGITAPTSLMPIGAYLSAIVVT
jgi:hypothetical protein